ncbi:LOW QUALITY PROTEIN: polycystin-1 [Salminus brasiliensis]|uniref:LOW QUALITY PROTEIN: polycystin-1 n=1 Tax=Salminus brasiliensis TaxID=930266 RepID=UPI003B82DD3D
MPWSNGQTVPKRKHGGGRVRCPGPGPGPGLGLLPTLLFALGCLEASSRASGSGSDGQACSPCPGNCSCAVFGHLNSCVVNCSNRGLEWAPAAADLPSDTSVLDLSRNRLSSVDSSLFDRLISLKELYLQNNRLTALPQRVFGCGSLAVLDLSNNQVTTIEGRLCDNLFNLTTIDLSGNPFVCDCMLVQMVSLLQKREVTLRRADHMLCDHPSNLKDQPLLNISSHTCKLYYAGCLQDSGHPGGSELVIFSSLAEGKFSRKECNSRCFLKKQLYGGLGARNECLCSTNSEPNHISEAQCSAACSDPRVMRECGLTVASDVFQVDFSVQVSAVRTSVHSEAVLNASSSVLPVSLSWDFGDLSPRLNTSSPPTIAQHKYGVPGRYKVQLSATAAHKEVTAVDEVSVELPPRLELHCPSLLVVNQSLEEAVTLVNWGGLGVAVNWTIKKDGKEVARAEPVCVPDAVHHADSSRCFQLVPGEFSWSEARRQCSARGGELAMVRTSAVQNLLGPHITQERGVWLGLSDVDSPGTLRWVDGSEARPGEDGARDRATLVDGNVCVSLDHSGLTSAHPCNAKRAFFCQFTHRVRVSDGGVFMVGMGVFNAQTALSTPEVSPSPAAQAPANTVELLLFPALSFGYSGRLSSLELITHSLSSHTQVRFQVYRPHCPQPGQHLLLPGCGDLCAPIAMCRPPDVPLNNSSVSTSQAPPCPALQQWCLYSSSCLPLRYPCSPDSCPNCSGMKALPPLTLRPQYRLLGEVQFSLPSGPSTHILVQKELDDLLVAPGDFIGLQHDAGPSGLLGYSSDPSSPWKQSFLVQNRSDWLDANETLEAGGDGEWVAEAVCPIRVLYVQQNDTKLRGPFLKSGLPQTGDYSLEVMSDDPDFPVTASCPVHVIPPLGLTVIHPASQNGIVYFLPNQTSILVKVRSEHSAVIGWQDTNDTVPFQRSCPPELVPKVLECRTPDPNSDALFAWLDLQLGSTPQQTRVVLHAQSEVTEALLEIQARVEEPLRGLNVQPHPNHRVLMESVVSYAASVEGGTDPSFRWTVDDKPYFTYYNTVLNIIYQNAAVYKLTVTAMNNVSILTEDFNVTVDKMNPMSEITVRGVPEIVTQGRPQTLSAMVEVDVSVDVTFRWSFGDKGDQMHHFKPPYSDPHQSHDPSKKQVVLHSDVTYTYTQPGEYTLMVSVSNRYENRTRKVDVYVYSILTVVEIKSDPELLQARKSAAFEAHPLPSPYGIIYTWDFGDNSSLQAGRERRVYHAYEYGGTYTVWVNVNNTVSSMNSCKEMMVYEDIEGLEVTSSSPTELNTLTVVAATLEAGNNVSWTFAMGDGTVQTGAEPRVEHRYIKDGNYTVNVTASNAISSKWVTVHVQVFVLQVLWLEPAGCVQEKNNINFHAYVSGNASAHQYVWSFGDGTANETHNGSPSITHSYDRSGNYHLSLLMSSSANKANFFNWICVQPAISNVTLEPSRRHIRLGEKSQFTVTALPDFEYTYLWDFGISDSKGPIQGSDTVVFTYKSPGLYLVTVTVLNNISYSNCTVQIEVQQPVGYLLIQHNGSTGNSLALRQDYAFSSSSDSANVVYSWDFGDGTVLPGHHVTHAYNSSGTFSVCVVGKNEVSENKSELTVTVLAPIRGLSINASRVNVPLNTSVNFEAHLDQGDEVRYSWILCDRCTSIVGTHIMFYTFRSVGTFNVIVTAENDISTTQSSIFIFVQRELEGLQIASDELADGCCFATNRILHLQAFLKEGTNMSFSWNLLREHENTAALNLTGKTIELNYSTPGPCEVLLKATNLLGQIAVNRTIEFLDPVGKLVLEASPNPTAVNTTMNLTVLANTGSDLQYRWLVGGHPLPHIASSVSHEFDSPGLKVVTVEVSNRVNMETSSVLISVQEPVSGVAFTATSVTEQNFVATGVSVALQGHIQTGSNVSWMWTLPNGIKSSQQATSYVFPYPGTFTVTLNASNDISSEALSRDFFVQDRIQGLEFRASKQNAAVGENVEFTISVSSGTSVSYTLSISGDATVHPNMTYVHQFSRVDNYYVNLTASNQISSERRNLHICVLEPITKLAILDCCEEAIPVGVPKTFEAHIATGNPVRYIWTFDLHHGVKTTKLDSRVTYVPEEPGFLTIIVSAFNVLSVQNETKDVYVQNILKSAFLDAQPKDTFINKTVRFHAGVSPQSSSLTYRWDFGDGTSGLQSSAPLADHVYSLPGRYRARVNISNLVSSVTAHFDVNIRVLECKEPEVQVVQAPRLAIWRSKPALVEAKVDLKHCARYDTQYLWEIFSTPDCQDIEKRSPPPGKVRLPAEVDVRRLQLSLPKMSLAAKNYTLIFSLSYRGVPLRKAACLQLSVMSAKLVPIIEGGTYRVWSKTQDLQLSAEQSYDPNLDPESQTLLNYHWECVNTSKGASHCSTLNFGLGPRGPVLGISGSELEVDVEYTFRLTISKEGMPSESTTQKVLVKTGRIPIVSLECVSCKAQSRYEISQNSYVYLAGTCSNCQGSYRGSWTAVNHRNETLILDHNTTTTAQDSMNLVLRKGSLRDGDSYIFSLHVADDSMDGEGVAYIKLRPNLPPAGGACVLWADKEGPLVRTLLEKVHFKCTGYADLDETESPLVYSLLVLRCSGSYCEDFCVYKGTSPEHSAFLPPGFSSAQFSVTASVMVEDHQGASITAIKKTMAVVLPEAPEGFSSVAHWLSVLTDTNLKELLKQGDSQRVRELSLALITVLNGHEQAVRRREQVSRQEWQYRVSVRGNITRALTSLDLNTVSDIQQTSAALAQCTAVSREFVCEECQNSTLNKLESMLEILQTDTKQGTVTPTEIADNILNIMGDLIHQVSQAASSPPKESEDSGSSSLQSASPVNDQPHHLRVAAKAYTLSSELMRILMLSRVLNEEPLILQRAEIAATGKLADSQSLLCYGHSDAPECHRFSIPRAFNSSLGRVSEGVVQILFQVEANPFPFNYVPNYTVSTEVASMEFRTVNGTQIPISDLDESQAITVAINNGTAGLDRDRAGQVLQPAGVVNVSRCSAVIITVSTGNTNRQAGVYIQLNFTVVEDSADGHDPDPLITAYLHTSRWPSEHNSTDRKRITLNMTRGQNLDHQAYTFFLSPLVYDTTRDYYINVSGGCSADWPVRVQLEVSVFTALCQYFSEQARLWLTDGIVPLAQTSAGQAVCRTRHLTAFAASLFVPSNTVSFVIHDMSPGRSLVVVLVCVICVLCYAVAGAVLRKLDQMDLRRASVVPLCGKDALYKYEIQVKTGWTRGAGTTAHVGISLHGSEGRSGHRHLDRVGAFTRNSLDIFHIATDTSLGSVLKIRVWHDNKGLSPAWLLQYVLVKDLQTGSSYFFLVEEWLSVDNEKTDGRVEIEAEASEEAELHHWPRLFSWELQRAVCESHMWLSLWERPPRSPFTRLQRVTCCSLLLHLILLANTVWYATVTHGNSSFPVSEQVSLNAESVGVGVVSCLVLYPLYLLIFCLFRLSRSKVSVEQLPPQVDQESLEIDDFLDNSMTGSSFLIFNGIPTETYSEETNIDLPTPSSKRWSVPDADWPDVLTEPSVEIPPPSGFPPRLKRGQGSRHLGVDMAFSPEEEETVGGQDHRNKYFTSSDEDLIKRILADGQLLSQTDSDMGDLSSIFGDKTEVILLQKMSEPVPPAALRRDPPKTAFTSRTVVTDVCKPRPLPPLCGLAALWGSWVALILSSSLSIWLGRGFSEGVALMWLISCISSFMMSFCILEPLKVLLEGVYFGLLVGRLRPEEGDVLVDCPRVERVIQRVPRVRPPQGFALNQAREEARKIHLLHSMLKGFLVYMLFLLVVLLLNYTDSAKDSERLRLHTQLESYLHPQHFSNISRRELVWEWLSDSLLPRLLDNSSLMEETGSLLLGKPRLRQIRSQSVCPTKGRFPASSWFGCGPAGWVESASAFAQNWSRSVSQSNGVWHWGQVSVYDSGGFVQELSRNTEDSRTLIQQLLTHQWLDPLTRALFVEFSLYNTNTDLLAVFSLLLEFPVSERAQSSLDLKTCSLHTLRHGLDLSLFLTLLLMIFIIYFSVREGLVARRQGRSYFLRVWNLGAVCTLLLAAGVSALHLSRTALAAHLWATFLQHRESFTDFFPLAQQSQVLTQLNATLLFLLVLKASHQLRFLREWAVFGRTLRRSVWELLSAALALLVLLLAYSHMGHMLFHSVLEGYATVSSACLSLLGSGSRSLLSWRLDGGSSSCSSSCLVFHLSFAVLRLILLWLATSALLRNYHRVRAELYQPVVDLQDYEMVELFLRRLKMWMGLSRTKEFRHKVRFEGMELPPSRSSSTSDCKSLCLPPLDTPEAPPTPDSVDCGSEASWRPASSSPCSLVEAPGLGLGLSVGLGVLVGGQTWRERAETEATLRRVLPAFDALLLQLDRVTQATEELYRTECRLEKVQRKGRRRSRGSVDSAGQRKQSRGHSKGSQTKGHKHSHATSKSPHKAERNLGASDKVHRKSDKSSHKTQKVPRKGDTVPPGPQQDVLPKDSSPQRTYLGPHKAQASPDKTEVHASKTEKTPHQDKKVDSNPVKVQESDLKAEASAGSVEAPQKTAKGPQKAASNILKEAEAAGCASKQMPPATPVPTPNTAPPSASGSTITTPVPIPRALEWFPPREELPSSLFHHPAHTTTMPTRKRKHKPPPLKNKVHPNPDRPISGHPKP